MNRIKALFAKKKKDILNVYFTAGFPELNDTTIIIEELEKAGVDLIELGIPYSDPLADGTTIQHSSSVALKNKMSLSILFEQVRKSRVHSTVPIILMGYYNQMLQYGVDKFLSDANTAGVDGMIIPDIPMNVYESKHKSSFESNDMLISFLITPQTSVERIRKADELSSAFIYIVSQSSITGKTKNISSAQVDYFKRIESMKLHAPKLIGFGIYDNATYKNACQYANGAIIGSEFIRRLGKSENIRNSIPSFIQSIRGK